MRVSPSANPRSGSHHRRCARARWVVHSLGLSALLSAALGCTGTIASGGGPAGGGGAPTPGSHAGASGQGGRGPEATAAACTTIGSEPIRRLTRAEYDATVEDLLGDVSRPAQAFPADALRDSFDNNSAVQSPTALHVSSYLSAAETLAQRAKLADLVPCTVSAGDAACADTFIQRFGQRAFRRPLDADERTALRALFDSEQSSGGFEAGIRGVLTAMLAAPQFLYRAEADAKGGKPVRLDAYAVATRLSYFLTGSMPDAELFAAAEAGRLSDRAEVSKQAERLLGTARARARVREFFGQWLQLQDLDELSRDPQAFPGWQTDTGKALLEEAQTFGERLVFDERADFKTLVAGTFSYRSEATAKFYGGPSAAGSTPTKVSLPQDRSAGVLTMAGALALLAKADQPSPIYRGRWFREQFLCQPLPPPPPGAAAQLPMASAATSARKRYEQHAVDPKCATCHHLIDPVGFLFENYDSSGRYRSDDHGAALDSHGKVEDGGDLSGSYANAVELGRKLGESEIGAGCFAQMVFRFAQGRSVTDADACTLDWINQQVAASGGNLRQLLLSLVASDAFLNRMETAP